MPQSLKIAYLFTTFPAPTEIFLQREIRALREFPVELQIFSLWGGKTKQFEGLAVRRFSKWTIPALLWLIPLWLVRNPGAFRESAFFLLKGKFSSILNLGENLLGWCFALIHAGHFRINPPDIFHAPWATMPAAAAQMISRLTGIPYSMGAHAYDLFENGGDGLLAEKIEEASFIHTTTKTARDRLIQKGADTGKIALIHSGVEQPPGDKIPRSTHSPLQILSVGRLIEKKGYFRQLDIYLALRESGVPFNARIAGQGPLENKIRQRIQDLDLSGSVSLLGHLDYSEIQSLYLWADLFVFTGIIAASGDRDGMPNVILEAMATGVPVVAAASGGVSEAIENGRNGFLVSGVEDSEWVEIIRRLMEDEALYKTISREGQKWVQTKCNTRDNARLLFQRFHEALHPTDA